MPPPLIAGLYPYRRAGVTSDRCVTLSEIPRSLTINPAYRELLTVYAGDAWAAGHLESFGLRVARVFDDAPAAIQKDTAHKMKHWMCLSALETYGELVWVDWDTVMLRSPDQAFWDACRVDGTPKFVHIPGYRPVVNCGVYYVGEAWRAAMIESFAADVPEPNDELLWRSVLPPDLTARPEFWWGSRVVQVSNAADFDAVAAETYFAHVKDLGWADVLRARASLIGSGPT